jgi:hypothetical protein
LQGFTEKAFGGLGIPRRAQEKLERVSVGIDRSVEIRPGFSDFYIGLIDAPGVRGGFEVWPASFLQFRCIALDPTVDGGVIDVQTPLQHHFLQIAVTERVPQIPADAQQNDVGFEMTPFEQVLLVYEGNSSSASIQEAELTTSPPFLQHNLAHGSCQAGRRPSKKSEEP